ncbi:MAG: 4Fe-4S dicluster domain-containing protein [Deltaproteobacteria bacterium]|nr:4Fe-4S dicluster domain-containing protein [Deltaproteobacteria bacterium]
MGFRKVPEISRRYFLRASAGIAAAGLGIPRVAHAGQPRGLATIIDLNLCDGCPGREIPACVAACRDLYQKTVPDPVDPIPRLFPRGKIEDWSKKKHVYNRLTPYNFIFVEKAEVEFAGKKITLFIPRRCMHCDNPACATICPFAANHKMKNGAVVINDNLCVGGAKCRTVCPWAIPQRQSGVGPYLYFVPTLAGNGSMFKCHLCNDLLLEGKTPVCMEACPTGAMTIGERDEILADARGRAQHINGYLYGKDENGGTSTFYVSPVPFDMIDKAIPRGEGLPHFKPVKRSLEEASALEAWVLASPFLGIAAAVAGAYAILSGKKRGEGGDD